MTDLPQTKNAFLSSKWAVLAAASAGMFLGSLDITVNVALPDITEDFGTDVQTIQWIIIFYVGGATAIQLGLGSAADIYGLKRFYLLGLGVYTLAVLLIGLAPSLPMVFGLRLLQAVGNGLILAAAPALITRGFPPEQRGRGLGLMVGLATVGLGAGALGGGFLVDALGWRAIFLARVPLGIGAVVLAAVALREPRASSDRPAFDLKGSAVLFVALAAAILCLTLGGRIGWASPVVLALAGLAAVAAAVLAYVERSATRPVIDVTLLRHRVISPAAVAGFLMSAATFVNLFILPFYVSDVLGVDAKALGLLLMLTPVAIGVASPLGGWLSDKVPGAYLATTALVVVCGAMFWSSMLNADSSVADVAVRMAVLGVGMGVFQTATANLVMGSVPGTKLGTGAAIMSLTRSVGIVSSVAVLSALFASRLDAHSAAQVVGVTQSSDEARAFVLAFRDTYRVSGLLVAAAIVVSFAYWPAMLRLGRPPTARRLSAE